MTLEEKLRAATEEMMNQIFGIIMKATMSELRTLTQPSEGARSSSSEEIKQTEETVPSETPMKSRKLCKMDGCNNKGAPGFHMVCKEHWYGMTSEEQAALASKKK